MLAKPLSSKVYQGRGYSMHIHTLWGLKLPYKFCKYFNMQNPTESPVLMQRISKFHIPAQLSGIHIPALLSHLLQTCQDQSTDYHVPQTEKQHILGEWDSKTDPLGKLQFKNKTPDIWIQIPACKAAIPLQRETVISVYTGGFCRQRHLYLGPCGLGESTQSLQETHPCLEQQIEPEKIRMPEVTIMILNAWNNWVGLKNSSP